RQPGPCERARIVRLVAVLTLELDEPADRQPVERVQRLARRAQDLCARREADPELEDADPGQTGHHEMTELVDQHEAAEDDEEQDDRDDHPERAGHARAPGVHEVAKARTSVSRAIRASTSGAWSAPVPNRSTAAARSAGIPVNPRVPPRNRPTPMSSAAMRAVVARCPIRPA